MARRSTKSVKAPKPRKTLGDKCLEVAVQCIRTRFITKPSESLSVQCSFRDTSAVVSILEQAFPDYEMSLENGNRTDACVYIKSFSQKLITEDYAGDSTLTRKSIDHLISLVNSKVSALRNLNHPDPLPVVCESLGLTLRGYIDLKILYSMLAYNWRMSLDMSVVITKAPKIPNSTAKIKLGAVISDDGTDWCYTAKLAGDYTPEQKALAAQELFGESARFDASSGLFIFDHYPKTLAVAEVC